MNLHLLRVFAAVAEHHSFSRAATALHISQPAVSKAVRELERQLDLTLIERTAVAPAAGRTVRLSESGQALFDHARGIFALERAAADDIRARVELKRGRLTLGASTTVAGYWLPAYLAEFARRHPGIQLQMRVGNTQSVAQSLIDCEIDLALVEGPVSDARISPTLWREDELDVIARPGTFQAQGGPPTRAELGSQVWLLREPGSGTREVTDRIMRDLGLAPERTVEIGSNEGIARAVAAGFGIALLPARVGHELVRAGALQSVSMSHGKETTLMRPLYLLHLKERPSSHVVRAFCAVLESPAEAAQRSSSM